MLYLLDMIGVDKGCEFTGDGLCWKQQKHDILVVLAQKQSVSTSQLCGGTCT